ncbi:hypothetical protein AB0A98_42370, partial [Streptomyces chrestomyceticus]|uniref:hypothetical protein n=1 Tax=Streptomyces chrestomyceticus TaxID=68185 RepID=UPI0033F70155
LAAPVFEDFLDGVVELLPEATPPVFTLKCMKTRQARISVALCRNKRDERGVLPDDGASPTREPFL